MVESTFKKEKKKLNARVNVIYFLVKFISAKLMKYLFEKVSL